MILEFLATGIFVVSSIYQNERAYSTTFKDSSQLLHSAISHGTSISEYASITIFNHGLGGSAYDWLTYPENAAYPRLDIEKNGFDNNGVQTYENHNYIPFELSKTIYILTEDLQVKKISLDENGFFNFETSDTIQLNLNEHLVILFDQSYPSDGYIPTLEKYDGFETAVDSLIYEYYQATSIIPKINLVGHSLGGVINTMYANHHPFLVSNMIGIGSPYLGSRWAEALDALEKTIKPYEVSITKDVFDSSCYLEVLEEWLKVKEQYQINAVAIACTQSYQFLAESIDRALAEQSQILATMCNIFSPFRDFIDSIHLNDAFNLFVNDYLSKAVRTLRNSTAALGFAARLLNFFVGDEYSQRVADALSVLFQVLALDFQDDTVMGSLLADCCVEVTSQLSSKVIDGNYKSYGFSPCLIHFEKGAYNYERAEFHQPGFLHNFETKAPEISSVVISTITNSLKDFHNHDFSLANDDLVHYLSCECGAKTHMENHGLSIYKKDNAFEYYGCNCGYKTAKAHKKIYESYKTDSHSFHCDVCGLETSESHQLQYFDYTKLEHMIQCDCGYSTQESHAWFKNTCKKCKRKSQSQWEINP